MIKITESNVTVMVKNMDASVKFYGALGLTMKNRWGDHYAQMAAADIIIGLHPQKEELPANTKISIGFMIQDINEAKKLLTDMKVPFKFSEAKEGDYLHFNDPDGNFLYYSQPKWK
jgi:catechol 2,3-dioxygenase-like lactoylglutathione lyase family enzyme